MTDISKEAIERYSMVTGCDGYPDMRFDERGSWVGYSDYATLAARVVELEEYAKDCTKALTGQTIGGSEFFSDSKLGFYKADIPACEKNIQWRLAQARKLGEAKGKAAQGQMVATVKPLERCESDEKLGWKIATSVLEDLEKEVRADGWETCLEVVQIVALSVEQRVLSARVTESEVAQGQMVASVKPDVRCIVSFADADVADIHIEGLNAGKEYLAKKEASWTCRLFVDYSAITLTSHAEAKREGMLEAAKMLEAIAMRVKEGDL